MLILYNRLCRSASLDYLRPSRQRTCASNHNVRSTLNSKLYTEDFIITDDFIRQDFIEVGRWACSRRKNLNVGRGVPDTPKKASI